MTTMFISASIIIISVLIALMMVRKEVIHCRELDECISMIKETGERASRYSESFSDIMKYYNDVGKYKKINISSAFIKHLQIVSPPEAWKSALSESCMSLYQWEKDILENYADKMFSCPLEQIEKHSNDAISKLTDFRENAKEKRNKTTKTNAICTVSAGLMIALLIL